LKETGITVTALQPGPTDTDFFHRAGMDDTEVGQKGKSESQPADVARQGIDALIAGKDHVYAASFKTKLEGALANLTPGNAKGAMHEKWLSRTLRSNEHRKQTRSKTRRRWALIVLGQTRPSRVYASISSLLRVNRGNLKKMGCKGYGKVIAMSGALNQKPNAASRWTRWHDCRGTLPAPARRQGWQALGEDVRGDLGGTENFIFHVAQFRKRAGVERADRAGKVNG
jgi:hypothetical protein